MAELHCTMYGHYNNCTGMSIGVAVALVLLVVAVSDLVFAIRGSRGRLYRSIEEYFWLWTLTHPLSSTLLAMLVGAMVSHFFWANKGPGWPFG